MKDERVFERQIEGDRPVIMGILNLTPDSFSDGGVFSSLDSALGHAEQMVEEGADIVDIGGESTRPGSDRVTAEEQLRRVLPVIRALRIRLPNRVLLSIDTTRSEVAEAAVEAGANIINDVTAGLDDPRVLTVAAENKAWIVLMHMQGTPKTMQNSPIYTDVVGEVLEFLVDRAEVAKSSGISPDRIIVDPGIGFGKRQEDNLRLIAELDRFASLSYPVLLGASRKRFMGSLCPDTKPADLLGATVATTVLGLSKGIKMFRVHDVRANRQAADVTAAVLAAGKQA